MLIVMHDMLSWENAWRIRIVALGLIVIIVGVGTQVAVNAIAANTGLITLEVSAYSFQGRMADGNWAYAGACSVPTAQFSLGTIIAFYNGDGSFNRQCTAEDSAGYITYGHIELVMPGDEAAAMEWGKRTLSARVLRWGWGGVVPTFPSATPSGEEIAPHKSTKPLLRPARLGLGNEQLRLLPASLL